MQEGMTGHGQHQSGKNTHIFILGSKGIPARYGGFETFAEKLTEYQDDPDIQYYVACQRSPVEYDGRIYEVNGAVCFPVRVPDMGYARAIYYDVHALKWAMSYVESHAIRNAVFFLCTYRIGPFLAFYRARMKRLGIRLVINPDGHEWLRSKWNALIKRYWRFSEKLCMKAADFVICDSRVIERYVKETYKEEQIRTTFIPYGAELSRSGLSDADPAVTSWYHENGVTPGGYYLNVARLVPENNYEIILREFMASSTQKALVIVSSGVGERYYQELKEKLHFEKDPRIHFAGTLYDQDLLKKIRENAYAYIHGHSVGGTNPSLLEAVSLIDLILLYDVPYNREVAEDSALYWTKEKGNLRAVIERAEQMPPEEKMSLGEAAVRRIREHYTWESVVHRYQEEFRREAHRGGQA